MTDHEDFGTVEFDDDETLPFVVDEDAIKFDGEDSEVATSSNSDNDSETELVQKIIVKVFKETGLRISKDDPVLAVALFSGPVLKAQTDILEKNYNRLSQAFKDVITSAQNENLQHFKKVVDTCGDLDNEIAEKIIEGKKEVTKQAENAKEDFTRSVFSILGGIKKDFEDVTNGYKSELKLSVKNNKSFSTKKAIMVCIICTVAITSILTGTIWTVMQQQKKQELLFYANGFNDIHHLVNDAIDSSPPHAQKELRARLSSIENRKE